MRRQCILCDNEISRKNSSKEHLLLKTLGGRKTTRMALCKACNTQTGREWDSVLERQLRRFIILVELPEETNKQRKEIIRESRDKGIVFKTGMLGGTEQPVELEHQGERYIVADDRTAVANEIRKRQRNGELTEENANILIASIQDKVQTETYVEFENVQAFGGVEVASSITKSMLTTACAAGFGPNDLLTGICFTKGKTAWAMTLRGQVPIATYLPVQQSSVIQRSADTWIHCVHVETDERARYIWGYVELYGTFRFAGIIGRKYMGVQKSMTYCIDITTGKELDVHIDMENAKEHFKQTHSGKSTIPEIWQQNAPNAQPLIEWALKRQGLKGEIRIDQDKFTVTEPERKTKILRAETRIIGEPYAARATAAQGASTTTGVPAESSASPPHSPISDPPTSLPTPKK